MEHNSNHTGKNRDKSDKNKLNEPDPETIHTTDPQEHMEGPISSLMQKTRKGADKNDQKPDQVKKHEHKKTASGGDFINE